MQFPDIQTTARVRAVATGAGALLVVQALFMILNAGRNSPVIGLRLHGAIISGSNDEEIVSIARQELERPLTLAVRGEKFPITPRELGARFNRRLLLDEAHAVGKRGSLFRQMYEQDLALIGLQHVELRGTVSRTLLSVALLDVEHAAHRDPLPPIPDFAGDMNRTLPAQPGTSADHSALLTLVLGHIFNPPTGASSVPMQVVPPVGEVDLAALRKEAELRTREPIRIKSGTEIFTLTPDDIRHLLTVVSRPDPHHANTLRFLLRLDSTRLDEMLLPFARTVQAATHAEFDDHDARSAIYAQFAAAKRGLMEIPTGFNDTVALLSFQHSTSSLKSASSRPNAAAHVRYYFANISSILGALPRTAEQDQSSEPQSPKTVYLTFDDGPNAVYHPLILDILRKYGVHATFFLVGDNAKRYDEVTKRTLAEGHAIGNHSLTHAFLPNLKSERIDKEIETTTDILESFTTSSVVLFRPPYGGVNPHVKQEAGKRNLKLTLWNIDPQDWSEPAVDELVGRVVSKAQDGANILMHSNHLSTVKALPRVIEALQAKGYSFATL